MLIDSKSAGFFLRSAGLVFWAKLLLARLLPISFVCQGFFKGSVPVARGSLGMMKVRVVAWQLVLAGDLQKALNNVRLE